MAEDVSNYPLSTELNDSIPLEVAKPERLHIFARNTTGTPLTFLADDNNLVCVSSDFLCFISTNSGLNDYSELSHNGVNTGVFAIQPGYSHMLALPKNCWLFSDTANPAQFVYLQEITRWAALGGQQVGFEVN